MQQSLGFASHDKLPAESFTDAMVHWCIGALVQCLYLRNFPCINCNEEAAVDIARGEREFFKKNAHETTFFL